MNLLCKGIMNLFRISSFGIFFLSKQSKNYITTCKSKQNSAYFKRKRVTPWHAHSRLLDNFYPITFVSSSSTSVVIEISSELVLGDASSVGGCGGAVREIGVVIPINILGLMLYNIR